MSFTGGIPASGQSLGATRDDIRNNFSNYNTLLAVDHVAPNATNQGFHKQVTFNLNQAAPSLGTGVSGLFSNAATGLLGTNIASLFFQNASVLTQITNQALTTNAQCSGLKLPSGLIINFGQVSGVSLSGVKLTFAVPFTGGANFGFAGAALSNGGVNPVTITSGFAGAAVNVYSSSGSVAFVAIGF